MADLIFAEPEVSILIILRRVYEKVGDPDAAPSYLQALEDLEAEIRVYWGSPQINPCGQNDQDLVKCLTADLDTGRGFELPDSNTASLSCEWILSLCLHALALLVKYDSTNLIERPRNWYVQGNGEVDHVGVWIEAVHYLDRSLAEEVAVSHPPVIELLRFDVTPWCVVLFGLFEIYTEFWNTVGQLQKFEPEAEVLAAGFYLKSWCHVSTGASLLEFWRPLCFEFCNLGRKQQIP